MWTAGVTRRDGTENLYNQEQFSRRDGTVKYIGVEIGDGTGRYVVIVR